MRISLIPGFAISTETHARTGILKLSFKFSAKTSTCSKAWSQYNLWSQGVVTRAMRRGADDIHADNTFLSASGSSCWSSIVLSNRRDRLALRLPCCSFCTGVQGRDSSLNMMGDTRAKNSAIPTVEMVSDCRSHWMKTEDPSLLVATSLVCIGSDWQP